MAIKRLDNNTVAKVRTVRLSDLTYNYIIKHHSSLATFIKRNVEVEQQLKQLSK